jgi:hypothetical protein
MAPSKLPLFLPPPPPTLDDFFGKSETSNSRQSASSQVQKRVETRRPRHRPKTKRVPPPEAEIIVIDSDDDTPLSCTTKRKAEDNFGCGSDVEIVEAEAITQRTHEDRAPSSGKKAKVESGHKSDDFDTQGTQDLFTPSQDDVSESDKPQLFRPAEDSVPKFIEGQNFQAARTIPSGDQPHVAAPALETYDSHRPLSEIQGDSSGVLPTSSSRADSDNVIEIDDEWGTGDDELVQANGVEVDGALEFTDDEVEAILKPKDESPATSEETTDQCPFCGITLTSLSTRVSFLARSAIVLAYGYCIIRTCGHTLLPAVTCFPLQLLRLLHLYRLTTRLRRRHRPRERGQSPATHSRYSCPRTRRIMHGMKPRLWKIAVSGQQKQTEGAERPLSTKFCKACPSPSMLSAMVKFPA